MNSRTHKIALIIAGIGLAVFVSLDAMGSHALQESLKDESLNRLFKAATTHLLLSCIGLILMVILGNIMQQSLKTSILLQYVGLIFFSLNLLILFFVKLNGGSIPVLGMIAPIGGTSFIASWLVFVWQVVKKFKS